MFALERRGMMSSLGERVKIALPRLILFTGLAFITETMMSNLCSKSDEKRSLFNDVSKLLKTRMLLSTKLENCSLPALGLMLQPGQGLLVAMETKVAWASVMISAGWAYLMHLQGRNQGFGREIVHGKAKEESGTAVDSKQQR